MAYLLIVTTLSAVTTWLLMPQFIRLLRKRNIIDVPNRRSSHSVPVPVGGGVALLLPVLVGSIILFICGLAPVSGFHVSLLSGILLLAILGFIDDLNPMPALTRLLAQSIIVGACVYLGQLQLTHISLPGLQIADAGLWGWLISWLLLVGFTNMFNFMDGINGLAGFQALTASASLAMLAQLVDLPLTAAIMALTAGGSVGFLRYNFPIAKVFLGDVGSLPLGFALMAVILHINTSASPAPPAWIPLLFIWPFLFDASYTLINRAMHKRNPFRAHRSHVYQRMLVAGWSHARVTLLYLAIMITCCLLGFYCYARGDTGWLYAAVFWGVFAVSLLVTILWVSRIRSRETEKLGS